MSVVDIVTLVKNRPTILSRQPLALCQSLKVYLHTNRIPAAAAKAVRILEGHHGRESYSKAPGLIISPMHQVPGPRYPADDWQIVHVAGRPIHCLGKLA